MHASVTRMQPVWRGELSTDYSERSLKLKSKKQNNSPRLDELKKGCIFCTYTRLNYTKSLKAGESRNLSCNQGGEMESAPPLFNPGIL